MIKKFSDDLLRLLQTKSVFIFIAKLNFYCYPYDWLPTLNRILPTKLMQPNVHQSVSNEQNNPQTPYNSITQP